VEELAPVYRCSHVVCQQCDSTFFVVSENAGAEKTWICPVCAKETPIAEWKGFPGNACQKCNQALESPMKAGSHKCAHLGFISGSAAY
jgi:hypothetical protein